MATPDVTVDATVSRRSFVKGAGAAGVVGAAVAGGLCATTSQARTADQVLDSTIDPTDTIYRNDQAIDMSNVSPIQTVSEPAGYDYECDVLLVGFGVGGTSAALTLFNNGVTNVIAMERSSEDNWYEHAGLHSPVFPGHKEWLEKMGIADQIREGMVAAGVPQDQITDDAVLAAFCTSDALLGDARTVEGASKDDQWAISVATYASVVGLEQIEALGTGCQFELVTLFPNWDAIPTVIPTNDNLTEGGDIYYPWVNKYHAVEHVIKNHCLEQGLQILWGTPATNFVVDGDGRVVGAKGVDEAGNDVYVKATRTILCTGGYGANYDMVKYYGVIDQMAGCHVDGLTNDGTGQRMAEGAGCSVRGLPRWCPGCSNGGIDTVSLGLGWTWPHDWQYPDRQVSGYTYAGIQLGREPFLKVNKYGKRFENEEEQWYPRIHAEFTQPEHRYFFLFDSNYESYGEMLNEERYGLCERLIYPELCVYFNDDDIRPMWDWKDELQDALDRGFLVKADTLEELAEKLGINPDSLVATVARYNELCDAGEDADYGVNPMFLSPLKDGPFYGGERTSCFLWQACGGVAALPNGMVIDREGYPIEGLYVGSGEAAVTDCDANGMVTNTSAGGGAFAIGMGYLAGLGVATELAGTDMVLGALGPVARPAYRGEAPTAPRGETIETAIPVAPDAVQAGCSSCHTAPAPAMFSDLTGVEETSAFLDGHGGLALDEGMRSDIAAYGMGKA